MISRYVSSISRSYVIACWVELFLLKYERNSNDRREPQKERGISKERKSNRRSGKICEDLVRVSQERLPILVLIRMQNSDAAALA